MNFTVTVIEDALWSGLEINLGIINACLPVMHPALQKVFGVPLSKLLSLTSTWRSSKSTFWGPTKPSKFSFMTRSSTSGYKAPFHPRFTWQKLEGSTLKSKFGITQTFSVDVEQQAESAIPMESLGTGGTYNNLVER